MQTKNLIITVVVVLLVGTLAFSGLFDADAAGVVTWDDSDEVEAAEEAAYEGDLLEGEADPDAEARSEIEGEGGEVAGDRGGPRPTVTVIGRVVDKHKHPVANALVDLSVQGRGRRSRISKKVTTKADGTFAFSGKGFTRLWVSLQVRHDDFAPASAFKPFNEAKGDLDMGDIEVVQGGTILGSITDMQGSFVPAAEARLQSMDSFGRGGRGGGRFGGRGFGRGLGRGTGQGDNDKVMADANGFFRIEHVAPGRYRVSATAPHRQRRTEGPVTVVDGEEEQLEPIQLGPGFALSGTVFEPGGDALAAADVSVRGSDRRSRDERTKTDKEGKFVVDHLPPGNYSVTVKAKTFLTNREHRDLDVEQTPPLAISMEAGLRISGLVVDALSNEPVLRYGAKVVRIGGLPDPDADRKRAQMTELFTKMRELRGKDTPEAKALSAELRKKMQEFAQGGGMRGMFGADRGGNRGGNRGGMGRGDRGGRGGRGDRGSGDRGRGGRGDRGGWSGFGRNANLPGDTGEVVAHAAGKFSFSGLEEGRYVVDIGSEQHVKLRSEPVLLQRGAAAPVLNLVAQRGLVVSGVVVSKDGNKPLRNANVELRLVVEEASASRGNANRRDRGGRGGFMRRFTTNPNEPRTTRLLSTRTDGKGQFSIENAPFGRYLVRASAEDHTTTTSKVFDLKQDRPGLQFVLGSLGVLEGRVVGAPPGGLEGVRVMAFSLPRNFRNVEVEKDGTYRITGLQPGGYFVRAFKGDTRRFIMGELFRNMGTDPNAAMPAVDVDIKEGTTRNYNVPLSVDSTGSVRGKVLVNGQGAKGYRVSMRQVDQGNGQAGGGRSGFGRMRAFGRNNATVGGNGEYVIKDVAAGQYTLTISGGGSGRGGRGGFGGGRGGSSNEISRQQVYVAANAETMVPTVLVDIGSLVGTITIPPPTPEEQKAAEERAAKEAADAAKAAAEGKKTGRQGRGNRRSGVTRGRVTLYKGVSTVPDPSQPGSENVLRFSANLRGEKFEFKDLPSGDYLLQLRVSGRESTSQSVYIGAGGETRVEMNAGKTRQRTPGQPGNRGNGGKAGNRNPGGQRGGRGPGGRNQGRGPGGAGKGR